MQVLQELIITGTPICRGIAIGKPFFLNRDDITIYEMCIPASHTHREIDRYRHAISRSKQDIKRLQKQLEIESASEGIQILEAQLEMLQDPLLTIEIENEIQTNQKNVEFVFQQALLKYRDYFQSMKDSYFAERFQDLQDLARRIFGYLHESGNLTLNDVPPNSIVCSSELTATDAAGAQAVCVSAFLTETGGATTHAAIVAKAKGIPYITNLSLDIVKENSHSQIIIDGRNGKVILNPSEKTLKEYEQLKSRLQHQVKTLEEVTKWPSQTFDGYSIKLFANIDTAEQTDLVHRLGGQGVGLFRSEYIFLPKHEIPSEEEQYQIYRQIVEGMKGLPVVIRTFDIGGDKIYHHPSITSDRNPFLGSRATRFLLKEQILFKAQLKAILQASTHGKVSILFPMISTLLELREAKRLLQEVREELQLFHPIPVGCMIEVPSSAIVVDHFVQECDFLSIGTNDLIQYSLAVDRSDQALNECYEPTDPSILRLIKLITTEANKAKIPVSVCGEMASDPRFTALLLGLGIQELSVAPRFLPLIKNAIRRTSIVNSVKLADKALTMKTAHDVLDLLVTDYGKNVPDDLFYTQ